MIEPGVFSTDPWSLKEKTLRLDLLGQTESLFALSNGHIGLRGNLDEGEPHVMPGSYLNGFFELMPMPYAEAGYGYPEQGQSLINVTDGKLLRLLVDDEPFDVRYGTLNGTSERWICVPGHCVERWSGFHRRGKESESPQPGSSHWSSERSRRCATRSNQSATPPGSSSNRR